MYKIAHKQFIMEKRHSEFVELERKAQLLLMDEVPPVEKPSAKCVLLLSVQPTFDNYVSWAVFTDMGVSKFIARHMIWDKLFDQQRFFDPLQGLKHGWHTKPTTTIRIGRVAGDDLGELLKSAGALRIGQANQRGIVLDGVGWFLKLPPIFGDQLLSWNAVTSEKADFAMWANQVRSLLESGFISTS